MRQGGSEVGITMLSHATGVALADQLHRLLANFGIQPVVGGPVTMLGDKPGRSGLPVATQEAVSHAVR